MCFYHSVAIKIEKKDDLLDAVERNYIAVP